ncbi:MAG: HD domain-containing phosphohydrolase, partial [Termitinemataceae bacterium]
HLGISGKIVYNKSKKVFHYFLAIRDITADVELQYFQKTDYTIAVLSKKNLDLLKAQKTIEAQKKMLISLVCSLLEEHNKETSIHIKRIQYVTHIITNECYRLGIVKHAPYDVGQYLQDIAYTSALHDIGKIRVPANIIAKTQGLRKEEYDLLKNHTKAGAIYIKRIINLLEQDSAYAPYIDFLKIPYSICLYHHERWDGTGYPEGKAGTAIPLPARIVAIADAYDAMRSNRTYNIPKSHAEAVQEIVAQSGKQFDPSLVRVFSGCAAALEDLDYSNG